MKSKEKESIYIKFLTQYKKNYNDEISEYFCNRLLQSVTSNIKDQSIKDNISRYIKDNFKIKDINPDENGLK